MVGRRFDVFLIRLDPTVVREIQKTRPCLIISPDEMNRWSQTVIIAPMTTAGRDFPTRVPCTFQGKEGRIVLDQLRTIDRECCIRKLGHLDASSAAKVLSVLREMFAT